MSNNEIAKIFFEIGDILNERGISHKPRIYHNASVLIDDMEKDLKEVYDIEGMESLLSIPGIGNSISSKIEEYLLTGEIKYLKELKKDD